MVLLLEILDVKCDTGICQPFSDATIFKFPCVFAFHHVFSDADSRKHQCLRWNWVANAATSVALRKQVSVLPFFVH